MSREFSFCSHCSIITPYPHVTYFIHLWFIYILVCFLHGTDVSQLLFETFFNMVSLHKCPEICDHIFKKYSLVNIETNMFID